MPTPVYFRILEWLKIKIYYVKQIAIKKIIILLDILNSLLFTISVSHVRSLSPRYKQSDPPPLVI